MRFSRSNPATSAHPPGFRDRLVLYSHCHERVACHYPVNGLRYNRLLEGSLARDDQHLVYYRGGWCYRIMKVE